MFADSRVNTAWDLWIPSRIRDVCVPTLQLYYIDWFEAVSADSVATIRSRKTGRKQASVARQ